MQGVVVIVNLTPGLGTCTAFSEYHRSANWSNIPMRTYQMDAGDACVFGSWLLHGGPPNHSFGARWIFFMSYFPESLASKTEYPIDNMDQFRGNNMNIKHLELFALEATEVMLYESGTIILPSAIDVISNDVEYTSKIENGYIHMVVDAFESPPAISSSSSSSASTKLVPHNPTGPVNIHTL